jgi:transcriptional regulator with XRE-family HTH domain
MSHLRDEDYIKSFGENLRAVRKRKNLSMSEIAKKTRVELNSLYRIEKGKVDISISTLKAIADALEIPPAQLLKF